MADPFEAFAIGATPGLGKKEEYKVVTCPVCKKSYSLLIDPDNRKASRDKVKQWLTLHVEEHIQKGELSDPNGRAKAFFASLEL
jgi:hypothetical protein